MVGNDPLAGAARRRSALEQAMQSVEHTAAEPAGKATWSDDIADALRELEVALNNHIVEVETPSGLLDQIVETAPRLQAAADRHRDHHVTLSVLLKQSLAALESGRDTAGVPVEAIRTSVGSLLHELALHRQMGADMVYEAYAVDIGGY